MDVTVPNGNVNKKERLITWFFTLFSISINCNIHSYLPIIVIALIITKKQHLNRRCTLFIYGGGRGIRTPAGFDTPFGFQDRPLQPDLGIPPFWTFIILH